MKVTIHGHAKINLTLDVLHKRSDGFHQVEMIMQAIELADIVQLSAQAAGEISLTANTDAVPCDASNLAYRAAQLLKDTCGVNYGAHIHLEKNIPVAAGLAGGSTDAAAVLNGLNRLWQLGLSVKQLEELGAKLGSDVPFCLQGGTMLATGRGEILSPLPDMPACWVVLAKPSIGVSTAWVYGQYNNVAVKDHPDTQGVIQALSRQDLSGVATRLSNALESVTVAAHPQIEFLKAFMLQHGAMASLMSGSGPTVFGLTDDLEVARRIAAELGQLPDITVFITKTLRKMGE